MNFLTVVVSFALCHFSLSEVSHQVNKDDRILEQLQPGIIFQNLNKSVEDLRASLEKKDPIKYKGFSKNIFHLLEIELSDFSLSGFSNFALTDLNVTISKGTMTGAFRAPKVTQSLRNFKLAQSTLNFLFQISDLSAEIQGLNIDLEASLELFPTPKVTVLKALPQIENINISVSSMNVNGKELGPSTIDAKTFTNAINEIFREIHSVVSPMLLLFVNNLLPTLPSIPFPSLPFSNE